MPNRLIREGLLESEAVLSVPVEARWLFVTIMLSADDVGLFEATEFRLGRKADVSRDSVGRLLMMLADVDLIRLYEVDGKRYGFIPRFKQRVQIKTTRHPLPPRALMADDQDAASKINNLASETTVVKPLDNRGTSAAQPSEVEVEVEERLSEEANASSSSAEPTKATAAKSTAKASRTADCPVAEIVAAYHQALPEWPRARVMSDSRTKAIKAMWRWVMTSTKSDGLRRAETAEQGMEWFRQYFGRVRANDFLMGRTPRSADHANWRPDIDYLMTDRGLKQVIEKTVEAA